MSRNQSQTRMTLFSPKLFRGGKNPGENTHLLTTPVTPQSDPNRKYARFFIYPTVFMTALVLGINYSLSVLVKPLHTHRPSWHTSAAVIGQSLMVGSSGFNCALIGRMVDRIGPRRLGVVSAVCAASGFALVGLSIQKDIEWLFYVTWASLIGFGIGVANMVTINLALKWNPQHRGFAGGFFGTSLGLGSVILSWVLPKVKDATNLEQCYYSVAAAMLLVLTPLYAFSRFPPKPDCSLDTVPAPPMAMSRLEMMMMPNFWCLFFAFVCGLTPGWGFVSQFPAVFTSSLGVNDSTAQTFTTAIIANYTAGRLIWGWVSDVIGRKKAYCVFLIGQCISFATLPALFEHVPILGCVVFFFAVSLYSGVKATYGPYAFDVFGASDMSTAIGLLLMGYGVAGLAGSNVGGVLYSHYSDFTLYFYVMSGVALAGFLINLMVKTKQH